MQWKFSLLGKTGKVKSGRSVTQANKSDEGAGRESKLQDQSIRQINRTRGAGRESKVQKTDKQGQNMQVGKR